MTAPSFPRRDEDQERHPLAGCALVLFVLVLLAILVLIGDASPVG